MIFFARILDVSIGTLRIGMMVRGKRRWAGVMSFFETMIWLLAAAKVIGNLQHPIQLIAYAGGYATGTMLGVNIEKWLAFGQVVMRIIVPLDAPDIQTPLRDAGFFLTRLSASGRDGAVLVLLSVMKRKKVHEATAIISQIYPKAFVTIEEAHTAQLEEMVTRDDEKVLRFKRLLRK